jgi:hypothetical protein
VLATVTIVLLPWEVLGSLSAAERALAVVVEPYGDCWQRFFDYHHQLIDLYDLPLPSKTSYLLLLA